MDPINNLDMTKKNYTKIFLSYRLRLLLDIKGAKEMQVRQEASIFTHTCSHTHREVAERRGTKSCKG